MAYAPLLLYDLYDIDMGVYRYREATTHQRRRRACGTFVKSNSSGHSRQHGRTGDVTMASEQPISRYMHMTGGTLAMTLDTRNSSCTSKLSSMRTLPPHTNVALNPQPQTCYAGGGSTNQRAPGDHQNTRPPWTVRHASLPPPPPPTGSRRPPAAARPASRKPQRRRDVHPTDQGRDPHPPEQGLGA